jgi:hypothetical protein
MRAAHHLPVNGRRSSRSEFAADARRTSAYGAQSSERGPGADLLSNGRTTGPLRGPVVADKFAAAADPIAIIVIIGEPRGTYPASGERNGAGGKIQTFEYV